MKVHVYSEEGSASFEALKDDQRRFAIALHQGITGNAEVYEILPANLEAFRQIAQQHNCVLITDFQRQFLRAR